MDRIHHRNQSQKQFQPAGDCTYIAFYKPYAVLTQFSKDPGSNKSTLAEFNFPPHVYSLGRLDFDSEGLLLLTDDARLNQILLHPTRGHLRTYLAQVENIPTGEQLALLRAGVVVQGQKSAPAYAELLSGQPDFPERPVPIRFRKDIPTAWVSLTLTEGRNRQVRRMTAAVGCPTLRLVRVAIGHLNLFELGLAPGQWIELREDQLLLCLKTDQRQAHCP